METPEERNKRVAHNAEGLRTNRLHHPEDAPKPKTAATLAAEAVDKIHKAAARRLLKKAHKAKLQRRSRSVSRGKS